MKKLSITLHIEMPEDFGTPDSMADMSVETLMEQVRKEVEYTCYTSTDADPQMIGWQDSTFGHGQQCSWRICNRLTMAGILLP